MGKSIIIAGKDSPDSIKFADGFILAQNTVILTGKETEISENTDTRVDNNYGVALVEQSSTTTTVAWNRSSPVSSRTLILEASNIYGKVDGVVLYFDEGYFARNSPELDTSGCSRCADEMILGYQYLTLESLRRFEKRNNASNPGTLVFVIKEASSESDAIRNPSLRDGGACVSSPIVASAAASFTAFAENIAAVYSEKEYVNIYLIKSDGTGDVGSKDDILGKWICDYIEANPGPVTAKKSVIWIKAGSKTVSSTFSFFGRR